MIISNRFMTISEYSFLITQNDCYRGKWGYFSRAIDYLNSEPIGSALELSITQNSDRLIKDSTSMGLSNCDINHDVVNTPWPINDKQFDAFIALDVFPHLEGNQTKVFAEIRRTANKAILSFPLEWRFNGVSFAEHNITEALVKEWTLGETPHRSDIVGFGKKRLIQFFKF
jgi:hypothetical protein